MAADPLIQLEVGGTAPVLRYDIPEPTSYEGKNFIALSLDGDVFEPVARDMPVADSLRALAREPREDVRADLADYAATGSTRRAALRRVALPGRAGRTAGVQLAGTVAVDVGLGTTPPPPDPPPDGPDVDGVLDGILDGQVFVDVKLVDGTHVPQPVPIPEVPDPHLYLVESLRLTSFLGDYGAGRIVKTFTLLPGERTRISMRTFLQKESTRKEASSVLDSLTTESAADLETSVTQEQSDQKSYQSTKEYFAEAEGSASWGWGSAKAKAGVKGSSNAAREESVKNVSNATEKHSARASAKREVEVNTSYEAMARSEEELSIERDIENVNRSRTLNFVFRQMNQAFHTFLHLTDVRVAFFNGDRSSRREVPLSRLDDLLDELVVEGRRDEVRQAILDQLSAVRDHEGSLVDVVRTVTVAPGDEYIRFDPDLQASVEDDRGRTFTVPGVLLQHRELVMRTEGVIVEAVLGNGDALDEFAQQVQQFDVARREAEVALLAARAAQMEAVNDAIASGDDAAVDRAERLATRCCPGDATPAGPTPGDGDDG